MSDLYAIKFNNGNQGFEVQGPDQSWVNTKAEELRALLKTSPAVVHEGSDSPKKTAPTRKATVSKSSSKKQASPKASSLTSVWTDEVATNLLAYVEDRKAGFADGTTKEAAIIAVFLLDELQIESVVPEDFELIYRKLGWKTINHVNQLKNAQYRDKYFEVKSGVYTLNYAGKQYGRDGSKVAKVKK